MARRLRCSFLVVLGGLFGCASFPSAHLLQGQAALEVVRGPVVCGPVGFRKVPLQARWGEYVRVTVVAPSALRGTVLVHANGVAQEPREWNTDASGALVVEARFPNESVERSFALERERPIDITLTGLLAAPGGTCEGAVFTVEHGALVPSIDERAWVAELERRGGPELAARREAARVEAEARRQAHYAQWAAHHAPLSLSPAGERVGERVDASEEIVAEGGVTSSASVVAASVSSTSMSCSSFASGAGSVVGGLSASTSVATGGAVSCGVDGQAVRPAMTLTPTLSPAGERETGAGWAQPFEPRLEPVPVTTEARVAVASTPPVGQASALTPTLSPAGERETGAGWAQPFEPVDPSFSVLVPAMFQLIFNLASMAPQQQAHAAQPIPAGAH